MTLRAISLFSNCGAGDVGYAAAGFSFRVIAELLPHRLTVAQLNHPQAMAVSGDLRASLPDVVRNWRTRHGDKRPDLLAACPPCQGMSSVRSGRGREADATAGSKDPRNLLVQVVIDAVHALRPRAVVVENVPAFLTRRVLHPADSVPVSAAIFLLDSLADDYQVFPIVVDLADFGVPQQRKRCFLTFLQRAEPGLAVLQDHDLVPYPRRTHEGARVSLREALDAMGLRDLDAKEALTATDPDDLMHAVPVWPEHRYRMIAAIPPDSGKSAWVNNQCSQCGTVSVGPDDARCPLCKGPLCRPVVVEGDDIRLIKGFRTSSYTRMHPDRPAATITTASGHVGSDKTIHPSQNRLLSTLECALLQTFPMEFRWGDALEKKGHTNVREMIGEAVPPMFTRKHGRVLAAVLSRRRPYAFMAKGDDGVRKAAQALTSARSSQLALNCSPPELDGRVPL